MCAGRRSFIGVKIEMRTFASVFKSEQICI